MNRGFWLVLATILSSTAYSQQATDESKVGVDVTARYMYMKYEEPGLMKDTGPLYGFGVGYQMTFPGEGTARAELDFLQGNLTYDGAYASGAKLVATSKNYLFNLRAMWINPFGESPVSGLAGLAFRNLHERTDAPGAYTRITSYIYAPFGLIVGGDFGGGWHLTGSAEYDLFLGGRVDTKLSEVGPGYNDVVFEQTKGFGYRLSTLVRKDFGPWALRAEPYYHYWKIAKSAPERGSTTSNYVEPDNNTTMYGVNIGADF
ncbi:MAG TPA: hypothetical protein VM432_11655 [Bdellovibrionales bacterium]|nr:hypothetical protein [Bdellovibrionales bacterium]